MGTSMYSSNAFAGSGDAHRLGILRQVGAVYQFRHAQLQDRLAAIYEQCNGRRS